MDYIIREAKTEDYPYILELIFEFADFQKAPEKVQMTADKMIEQKKYFNCLIATNIDGKIIGYTNYSIIYYSWVGKSIYLDDLYVNPAFRGKGVGSKLMNEVFNIARKEKCNRVRWQVSKWNVTAIQFYKKIGAKIDDVEINCDYTLHDK